MKRYYMLLGLHVVGIRYDERDLSVAIGRAGLVAGFTNRGESTASGYHDVGNISQRGLLR